MSVPFKYRVELLDRNDKLMGYLEDYIIDSGLTWSDKPRAGGCANGSITVYNNCPMLKHIEYGAWVKIYINSETSDTWNHVYSGYVVEKLPSFSDTNNYTIQIVGFASQLKNVIIGLPVALPFAGGLLITDILKMADANFNWIGILPYIAAHTDIIYDSSESYINTTTVTMPNPIDIQKTADMVLEDLAALCGNWSWGVDKDRKLYFRAPVSDLKTVVAGGKNLASADTTENWDGIKNRIFAVISDGVGEVYEADADMMLGTGQTGTGQYFNCGTSTTTWLKQEFTTTQGTISKVDFKAKLNQANPNLFDTDANMELSSTSPNWNTYVVGTLVSKSATHKITGTKSLRVDTNVANAGVYYKTLNLNPEVTHSLTMWVWIPYEHKSQNYRVSLQNPTTQATYDSFDFCGDDYSTNQWNELKFDFKTIAAVSPATTVPVRVTCYCQAPSRSVIYIDDCVLQETHKFRMYVSLIDNARTGGVPVLAETTVDILSTTVADYTAHLNYTEVANDTVSTYALVFSNDYLRADNTTPATTDNVIYWNIAGTTAAPTWI